VVHTFEPRAAGNPILSAALCFYRHFSEGEFYKFRNVHPILAMVSNPDL